MAFQALIAKQIPPWGALGLNSGVQDAQNLIWKLALALKDPDLGLERLLESYDSERRPIGERVGKTSLINMQSHALILDKAIGLSPEKAEEANVKAMQQYFDPSDETEGKEKRKEVAQALKDLDIEFYAHGAEVGWFYDLPYAASYEGRVIPNPQMNSDSNMELCEYRPTTRPGSQLPHVWLENSVTKERRSTRELTLQNRFLLLAVSPAWLDFMHPLLEQRILGPEAEWQVSDNDMMAPLNDILPDGALIVRPDCIIAFRFGDAAVLKQSNLGTVAVEIMRRILWLGH